MPRKRISDRTKLAATLLARREIPYSDAKLMTEDQINSLYEFHHNVHHSSAGKQTVVEDVDHFSNLEPMLIRAHLEQTKRDLREIAKSKRLRKANEEFHKSWAKLETFQREENDKILARIFNEGLGPGTKRRLRSRGFDKTRRRKMSGKVVKR
jgi:hypothetical protein